MRTTLNLDDDALALAQAYSRVMACYTGGAVGHRQVTDAYVLTAAKRNGMRLLTLDRGLVNLLASDVERELHTEVAECCGNTQDDRRGVPLRPQPQRPAGNGGVGVRQTVP